MEVHLENVLQTKRRIREDLRALPFAEKIKRVISMQQIARDLNKDPNRKIYVWNCDWE
jgi:hypothetical protein